MGEGEGGQLCGDVETHVIDAMYIVFNCNVHPFPRLRRDHSTLYIYK